MYTSLKDTDCRTEDVDDETGASEQECAGVGGYRLGVVDADARISVSVRPPGGGEHPLGFVGLVSGAFSSIGDRAEWRVTGDSARPRPVSVIIPYIAYHDVERPEVPTNYWMVVRVTGKPCVIGRLARSTPVAEVRRRADGAASAACLPDPNA